MWPCLAIYGRLWQRISKYGHAWLYMARRGHMCSWFVRLLVCVSSAVCLFVNLESYFISGLLHVSDLPDDRYHFLPDRNALKGKRRGGIYKLGQTIKVKIAAIFPLERKINLVISNGK